MKDAQQLQVFAAQLRRRREKDLGWSQQKAADEIGVSRRTYGSWENAQVEPSGNHAILIEDKMGLPALKLLSPTDLVARMEALEAELAELSKRVSEPE